MAQMRHEFPCEADPPTQLFYQLKEKSFRRVLRKYTKYLAARWSVVAAAVVASHVLMEVITPKSANVPSQVESTSSRGPPLPRLPHAVLGMREHPLTHL